MSFLQEQTIRLGEETGGDGMSHLHMPVVEEEVKRTSLHVKLPHIIPYQV